MAYFVVALSAWLLFSASTALRPGRKGIFAALAYPWAGRPVSSRRRRSSSRALLLGLLWWWGWPRTHILGVVILALAALVVLENLTLVFISFYSRTIVRRAMATNTRVGPWRSRAPATIYFGKWWRTALQIPFHPRHMQIIGNVAYGPEKRNRLDVWRLSTTPSNAPVVFYIHGGRVDLRRQTRAGPTDAARVRGTRLDRRRVQLPPGAALIRGPRRCRTSRARSVG
jgi:hypothetical protein